ncbi:MAG: DUF11 domain-containing protein, partial [Acidobacteriota bacterium]|nr:DUF11 domain-containing protein [Acidobacteriota bacterium]
MRRMLVVLALFFLPLSAHAQTESADLVPRFDEAPAEELVRFTTLMRWVRVDNNGPSVARNVVLTATIPDVAAIGSFTSMTRCEHVSACTIPVGNIAPGQYVYVSIEFELEKAIERSVHIDVKVSSDTPDPNPANNGATFDIAFLNAPQFVVYINRSDRTEPEMPFDATVMLRNDGTAPALDTTLDLTFSAGTQIVSVTSRSGVSCTTSGSTAHCTIGTLAPGMDATFIVAARAPAIYTGGTVTLHAHADSSSRKLTSHLSDATSSWPLYPTFVVDRTADSGPGTLRQALIDANAQCTSDCFIAFRVPQADFENGAAHIRVSSPLPPLTKRIHLEGSSEKRFTGQPALDHPLVFLDGAALTSGDAIQWRGDGGSIEGLAIGNFPGSAILVTPEATTAYQRVTRDCFLGTDATGTIAMPNLRGIMVMGMRYARIEHNVISGNRLSAIWLVNAFMPAVGA